MAMNKAQDLQDWLAARERQGRTQRAIDGFGRDWDRGEVQLRLTAAMAAVPAQTAEAVAGAARTRFADRCWLDRAISGLAEAMRADPFFEPPFRAMSGDLHRGLILFEDSRMSIAAGV